MLIFAHRGAKGYAPENTMSSFKKAVELEADGIEFDVQMTTDNEVVICHDHDIDRTSNHTGLIKDYTIAELKSFDFGGWFNHSFNDEKIPTLEEFFIWIKQSAPHMLINIEIKNGPIIYPNIEKKVIELVDKYNYQDKVIISSFYHPSLKLIKEINPKLKTGLLFDCCPTKLEFFLKDTKADYIHPQWNSVVPHLVEQAKALNVAINTYTIDKEPDFELISKYQIHGIFTDFPDKFRI